MENSAIDLKTLIQNGNILYNVEGTNVEQVFENICNQANLPDYVQPKELYEGLCERERTISTAMGYGIAIPHSSKNLIKSTEDQRIILCFLKNPIDMKAFDKLNVNTMFVILSENPGKHIKILQKLAMLLQNADFRKKLGENPTLEQLQEFLDKA